MNASLLTLDRSVEFPLPAYESGPKVEQSLSLPVIRLATEGGLYLDPWQKYVLGKALAVQPGTKSLTVLKLPRWLTSEIALLVPRQNGKNSILEALELAHLFLFKTEKIVHSAHLSDTARDAYWRLVNLIDNAPKLKKMLPPKAMSRPEGRGQIATKWGTIVFRTRTKDGARGLRGDLVVLDEAYSMDADDLAALIPTMSARPNPQIWYTSSTGMYNSYPLKAIKNRGRTAQTDTLYMEWCAKYPVDAQGKRLIDSSGNPLGIDLDDKEVYYGANPGPRITWEFGQVERRSLESDVDSFLRERYGMWEEMDNKYALTADAWNTAADSTAKRDGNFVLAIDVSPGSRCASIVSVGASGERKLIEVVAHDVGVEWVAPKLSAIVFRKRPKKIVLDPTGPAGVLIPEFKKHRIKFEAISAVEYSAACASFIQGVNSAAVVHLGDPIFAAAVHGAVQRATGDGLVKWTRSRSEADICVLVAATLGYWTSGKIQRPQIEGGASFA